MFIRFSTSDISLLLPPSSSPRFLQMRGIKTLKAVFVLLGLYKASTLRNRQSVCFQWLGGFEGFDLAKALKYPTLLCPVRLYYNIYMEQIHCPFDCIRFSVEGKCIHTTQRDQNSREVLRQLEAMKEARRIEKEQKRAEKVAWELDPLEWQAVKDRKELPHREGVYVWMRNGLPTIAGYYIDLWKGHYTRAEELEQVDTIWYVVTAYCRGVLQEVYRTFWGSERDYRTRLSKIPVTAESLNATLKVHPLYSLWHGEDTKEQLNLF